MMIIARPLVWNSLELTKLSIVVYWLQDELFEKGRAEILDDVLSLHDITPEDWEKKLYDRMWQTISPLVVDDIYISAAQNNSPGKFNTIVDIKLKHWAEKTLASTSIQVEIMYKRRNF